jgi:hypothetical protein
MMKEREVPTIAQIMPLGPGMVINPPQRKITPEEKILVTVTAAITTILAKVTGVVMKLAGIAETEAKIMKAERISREKKILTITRKYLVAKLNRREMRKEQAMLMMAKLDRAERMMMLLGTPILTTLEMEMATAVEAMRIIQMVMPTISPSSTLKAKRSSRS